MRLKKTTVTLISSVILSLGILSAGGRIGKGFFLTKSMTHSVTVKGLAEQDVKSDLGIWEINYKEIGNNLLDLERSVQHDQQVLINFLKKQGFSEEELNSTQIRVDDRLANIYNQNSFKPDMGRYVITAGMRVRSTKVDLMKKSVEAIGSLLQQGIPLAFDVSTLSPNPSYYFTKLDSIRPKMLANATKSAYKIAQQFAHDSQSALGGILRANQGVFQVMGRDTSTMNSDWNSNQNALGSIDKKVRLVTTIDYQLR